MTQIQSWDELLALDLTGKNVVIVGSMASGKTILAKELKKKLPYHFLMHSDDYMWAGFEQSLYVIRNDIANMREACYDNVLFEGIQGWRLLRKGIQECDFYPDIVIEMKVTWEQVQSVYDKERDAFKLPKCYPIWLKAQSLYDDYSEIMDNAHKPEWYVFNNNY